MADNRKKAKARPPKGPDVSGDGQHEDRPQGTNVAASEQDAIGRFIARHLRTLKGLSNR